MKVTNISCNAISQSKLNFKTSTNNVKNNNESDLKTKDSWSTRDKVTAVVAAISVLALIDIIFNKSKVLKRIFKKKSNNQPPEPPKAPDSPKPPKPENPKKPDSPKGSGQVKGSEAPKGTESPKGVDPKKSDNIIKDDKKVNFEDFKFEINEDDFEKGTYFAVYHPDSDKFMLEKTFDKIIYFDKEGTKIAELVGNPDKLKYENAEFSFELVNTKMNDRIVHDKKIILKKDGKKYFLRSVAPLNESSNVRPYSKLSINGNLSIKSADDNVLEFIKRDNIGLRTVGKYNVNTQQFEVFEPNYKKEMKKALARKSEISELLESTTDNIMNMFKEIQDRIQFAVSKL